MSDLPIDQFEQLIQGHHWDPLAILGAHPTAQGGSPTVSIRCFLPEANDVALLLSEQGPQPIPMTRIHKAGLFETIIPGPLGINPYHQPLWSGL
jgi:1,4-alpha-glucan branching enzyme